MVTRNARIPIPKSTAGASPCCGPPAFEVDSGILEDEARRLNEAFITYKTEHRPFGILKIAMTLDGKIATRSGESQWITSEESRARVQTTAASVRRPGHRQRHRSGGQAATHRSQRTSPPTLLFRVILDRRGRISSYPDAFIFRDSLEALAAELYRREIQSFSAGMRAGSGFQRAEARNH